MLTMSVKQEEDPLSLTEQHEIKREADDCDLHMACIKDVKHELKSEEEEDHVTKPVLQHITIIKTEAELMVEHEDGQPWNMQLSYSKNSTVAKLTPSASDDGFKKCPPPGYELVPGVGYYKVYGKNTKKAWQDAEDICTSEGGHLVVTDSELELLYVRMLACQYRKDTFFWVGIHDQYKEGDYITVLNQTMKSTKYSTWYTGEPNGGTKENCAHFYYKEDTNEYGLVDNNCDTQHSFICEINI